MTDKTMTPEDVVARLQQRHDPRHRRLGFTPQADGAGAGAAALRRHRSDRGLVRRPRRRPARRRGPDPQARRAVRHPRLDPPRTALPRGPPARRVRADGDRRGDVHVGAARRRQPAAVPARTGRPRLGRDAGQPRPADGHFALRGRRDVRRHARPCAWTRRWSTSTAPTGAATASTWAPTRTSTTCSARPRTARTSPASGSWTASTAAVPQTLLVKRHAVTGVVETPNGAHFTSCAPDYGRDEPFQKLYASHALGRSSPSASCPGTRRPTSPRSQTWHEERADERRHHERPAPSTAWSPAPTPGATTARCWRARWACPADRRPARPADLLPRPAAHRRRGDAGRPPSGAAEGWLPYRQHLAHGRRRPAARDDGREPARPLRQPEHLLHRRLAAARPPAAGRARRARQHPQQPDRVTGCPGTRRGSSSSRSTWSAGSATTARPPPGPSATRYHRIPRVVTDLGVFDFAGAGPRDAAGLRAPGGHGRRGAGGHRVRAGTPRRGAPHPGAHPRGAAADP